MRRSVMSEAPNYTNAALIMGGINLFWIMTVIWALYGFLAVLALGYGLDKLISRLRRKARS